MLYISIDRREKAMNKKVTRTLSAIACIICNEDEELIHNLHRSIADKRDGYPEFDFVGEVNSFRSLFGYYPSINYPE